MSHSKTLSLAILPLLALSCTAASTNPSSMDSTTTSVTTSETSAPGTGTRSDGAGESSSADESSPGESTSTAGESSSTDGSYPTPDKLIALTFDDGPDATATGAVLDKLEAHQVPATFFLIGQKLNAAAAPVLERALALGCEFANHSFGYDSLTGRSEEEIRESVEDTNAAIEQYTQTSATFFRPPNLATDATMYEVIDLPFVGGIVAGDFPAQYGGDPTVEAITQKVLSGAQDGAIVLMHDVQPELNPHPTPEALDTIIVELKQRGFEFVTLTELFSRSGVDPNTKQDDIWQSVP